MDASIDEDGNDPRLIYDFSSSGTYYIGVTGDLTTGKYELRLRQLEGNVSNAFKPGDQLPAGEDRDRLIALGENAANHQETTMEVDPLTMVKKQGVKALRPSGLGLVNAAFENSGNVAFNTAVPPSNQTYQAPIGYRIYRSTTANFEIDQSHFVADVSDTTWIDRNTVNRQTYYYKVTAIYTDGESGPSNTVQILSQFADQPVIALSDTLIEFGEVDLDSTSRKSIVVSNAGTAPLEISNILSDNEAFLPVISSFSLSTGESRVVEFVFRPTDSGSYHGLVSIFSNDYGNPQRSIVLSGEGAVREIALLGDVNADGTINILDALLILSSIRGLTLPQGVDLNWGDVDGNGITDEMDANFILSYTVGLPTLYPIGLPIGQETSIMLASNRYRTTISRRMTPQHLVQLTEWSIDGQQVFILPLSENNELLRERSAACLYEITWDPSMLSFEGIDLSNRDEGVLSLYALEKGKLLLAIAMAGGISRHWQPILRFRSLEGYSTGEATGSTITVRCLEQYSNRFEKVLAYHNEKEERGNSFTGKELNLYQNQPNPFNPSTTIRFNIPEGESFLAAAHLAIYNLRGKKIRTLINHTLIPGNYSVIWDGTDERGRHVASGVYFYRLRNGAVQLTRKMILMK